MGFGVTKRRRIKRELACNESNLKKAARGRALPFAKLPEKVVYDSKKEKTYLPSSTRRMLELKKVRIMAS